MLPLMIPSDLDDKLVQRLNVMARLSGPVRIVVALVAERGSGVEVALMGVLGLSGRPLGVLRMLAAVGLVYATVEALGSRITRARPFERVDGVTDLVPHDTGRSFPSRHVASAVAMAVVAASERPALGRVMGAVAGTLALARVAAGVHYPSDVLTGAGLGYVVGMLLRRGSR